MTERDYEKMLVFAARSISQQEFSGELYFAHHFEQVKDKNYLQDKIRSYIHPLTSMMKTIEELSTLQPYLFGNKEMWEEVESKLLDHKWKHRLLIRKIRIEREVE